MIKRISLVVLLFLVGGSLPAQEKTTPRSDAEKKALAKIQQLGAFAMELAQNDPRLEVSYHLMDKEITVEHLAPLKELKGIVHLNLRGRTVTDDMLAQVKDLTSLTRLHLEKTKVTDAGVAKLKKALPQVEIIRGFEEKPKETSKVDPKKPKK